MKQINCFGKINRILRVGPRRPDGFHDIFTVYQSISLFDTLTIELTETGIVELTVSDPEVPSDSDNLAWQSADLLMKHARYTAGVSICIEKRIPAGGGLGGGSSDAAGVLLLLNQMLGHPLSRGKLMELAGSLGSDVPFFLVGGTAIGTGRGEKMEPLADFSPFSFVAVFPGLAFPTGEMYRLLDHEKATLSSEDFRMNGEKLGVLTDKWENTFDSVVSAMAPKVAEVMHEIRKEGFTTILAGSGSTFLILGENCSLSWVRTQIPGHWRSLKLRSITRREAFIDDVY